MRLLYSMVLGIFLFGGSLSAQLPPEIGGYSPGGELGNSLGAANGELGDPLGQIDELNRRAQEVCGVVDNPMAHLPDIPGLSELKELLGKYNQLRGMVGNLSQVPLTEVLSMSNLIAQFSPTALVNKVRSVFNNIPAGNVVVSSVVGSVLSQISEQLQNPQINQQLGTVYNHLMGEYNKLEQESRDAAKTDIERSAAYAKMQEVRATMDKLYGRIQEPMNEAIGELQTANTEINRVLEQSSIGNVSKKLKEIVQAQKDRTIYKKAEIIVQKLKSIASVVRDVRDELKKICGMLPNGPAKDELMALVPDVLNGKIEGILNSLLRDLEKTLSEKAAGKLDKWLGPLGQLGTGVLNRLISDLTGIVRGTVMRMLHEGFNSLINRSHMGTVVGRAGCNAGQQAFQAAASAGRHMIEEQISQQTNKVKGFWSTPNVVKCR